MNDQATHVYVLLQSATLIWVGVISWGLLLTHRPQVRTWLPMEPRTSVPWGLLDVALIVSFWQLANVTAVSFARSDIPATDSVSAAAHHSRLDPKNLSEQRITSADCVAMTTASLAAWWLGSVWLLRRGATVRDLGYASPTVFRDVALGFHTYCLVAPPVLFVQSLLANFWPSSPHHPLVKSLVEHSNGRLYWSVVLAAVVGAPFVEEFIFRVVLQGWLERMAAFWHEGVTPWQQNLHEVFLGRTETCSPQVDRNRPFRWPIVVSALLFAAAHMGQGPAPISLFLLALGLGYVYERTHRWLPCVVTHMLINGVTMVQLWFIVHTDG